MALNRPVFEEDQTILDEAAVRALLGEVRLEFIQDQAGASNALAQEVWRVLLVLMALALLTEAILCLPPKRTPNPNPQREGQPA